MGTAEQDRLAGPSSNAPQLSIVIPAFNAAGSIGAQLASLRGQSDPPRFEVIVADNRSSDGTAEAARRAADGLDLAVVPALRAQGANCARNVGIAHSSAPLILCIDADDRLDPGALRAVVDAFAGDPGLGLAAGVPLAEDPVTFELPVSMDYLPYGISAFLAMRQEVVEAVGGFDEEFFGGQEEVDFCWRAQHAGYRIGVVRAARFDYVPRADVSSAFRQFRRYGATYIQLYVKHRERGIRGSSLRVERHDLGRVVRLVVQFVLVPEGRASVARALGWTVGRWQGNLRHRVVGPR